MMKINFTSYTVSFFVICLYFFQTHMNRTVMDKLLIFWKPIGVLQLCRIKDDDVLY